MIDDEIDVEEKKTVVRDCYNDFLNQYEFHQCEFKFNETSLADYLIIYDIETFRDEDTGILRPYCIAWTVRCQLCIYEEEGEENGEREIRFCNHSLEIHHVIGDNCLKMFLDAILSPQTIELHKDVTVFAHNGGKFDHLFLLDALNKY